jgi:uncharacterized iron-regulated membrane protein
MHCDRPVRQRPLLAGAVRWWPGDGTLSAQHDPALEVRWRRFDRDLHSLLRFWPFALLLMWTVSVYLAFPYPFYAAGDLPTSHAGPPSPSTPSSALQVRSTRAPGADGGCDTGGWRVYNDDRHTMWRAEDCLRGRVLAADRGR